MATGEDLEKLVRLLENPWYAMMSLKLGGIETGSHSLLLLEDMAWIVSMLGYGMLWHAMVWFGIVCKKAFHYIDYSTWHFTGLIIFPCSSKISKQIFDSVIQKLVSKHLWWKMGSVCLGKLFSFE